MKQKQCSVLDPIIILLSSKVISASSNTHNIEGLTSFILGAAVKQRPWLVVLEYCQYGDLSDVLKALGRRKIGLSLREQMSIAGEY